MCSGYLLSWCFHYQLRTMHYIRNKTFFHESILISAHIYEDEEVLVYDSLKYFNVDEPDGRVAGADCHVSSTFEDEHNCAQ